MAKASNSGNVVDLTMANEEQAYIFKSVLRYEAAMRGLTSGQVLVDIIMNAVDEDTYPKEVLDRLSELREESKARALDEALAVSSLE